MIGVLHLNHHGRQIALQSGVVCNVLKTIKAVKVLVWQVGHDGGFACQFAMFRQSDPLETQRVVFKIHHFECECLLLVPEYFHC